MFDNVTRTLIEQATPLSGLDMTRLPQELTAAYAKIVSLRVAGHASSDIETEIEKIEKIGKTYLALLLSCRNEHYQSIAFVAASAYSLIASYRNEERTDIFNRYSVCPFCISALLYIIADAVSDASEIAIQIPNKEEASSQHDKISQFIRNLSLGKLDKITHFSITTPLEEEFESLAVSTLYTKCLRGIQKLCFALLGEDDGAFQGALEELEETKKLSVEDLSPYFTDSSLGAGIYSTFPGAFILSSLLFLAANRLIRHSLASIQSPNEHFTEQWKAQILNLVHTRPYIWPNHARAIREHSVLRAGVSAVFSLPTGSGKTTLSNLKIASTLAMGGKVIFLAPTHALVKQVSDDLKNTFRTYTIKNAIIDGEYVETEDVVLADIAVMTPERCLAFLMYYPEAFDSVRLVIFDECHILHAGDWAHSYRASDSMMCLHRLFEHASQADYFLLSAMIENTEEIAGWVAERTGRQCVAVQDEWKPTRQVKGCVVFQKPDINKLNNILRSDRAEARRASRKNPSTVVKCQLNIKPWVFFGLNHTWNTSHVVDYLALPISSKEVKLSTNKYWSLSPNKNEVAASLATTLYETGIKTLIFVQQIDHTQSIAESILGQVEPKNFELTPSERVLLVKIEEELGDLNKSYVLQGGVAACHHGLLLKEERELVESLFRRSDGVNILVATPTLAQGMNLPAEAVILAGDERWDGEQNDQENLEAHELLNAAGRAGRAGYSAKGFVLVIPNRVVSLEYSNTGGASIGREWVELKERTFSKSDQCLTVLDPLGKLLDAVQNGSLTDEAAAHYLFRRIPYRADQHDENSIRDTLNKSLAAYVAKQKGQVETFNAMAEATIQACGGVRDFDGLAENPWMGALATEVGVDISAINTIFNKLDELNAEFTVYDFLDWAKRSNLLILFARHNSYADIVKTLTTTQERQQDNRNEIAYSRLIDGLKAWCRGATIAEISEYLLETSRTTSRCKNSRKLAVRWAPEASYVLGSVTRMYKYKCDTEGIEMPLCLGVIASLLRHGVDSPEKLALLHIHEYQVSRPRIHFMYNEIANQIPTIGPYASFRDVLSAVGDIYDRYIMGSFD